MTDVIGVARPRVDSPEKVTGQTRYAADGHVHGLLHARLVLATETHALIERINGADALEIPGVVAVLTRSRPARPRREGTDRTAEPLAREEVIFAGQPVAMVIAETEAAAQDGAEAVFVDYEPLEAVVDVETAMEPGACLARRVEEGTDGGDLESIHAGASGGEHDHDEQLSGNVLDRVHRKLGDAAAALESSDAVVSGTFRTPWVYQAYIEPQVATAWHEPDGTLAVSVATQGAFVSRSELARAYGLPLDRIRIIAEPLGGAFGGKFALVEPLAAGAALALRRPVRLVMTRQEDFAATNPASAQVTELEIGARKDGTLTGIRGRMIVDRGSNAGWGVEGITSLLVAGPYRWEGSTCAGTACRRTASRSARTVARERRRPPSRWRRSSTSSQPSSGSTRSSSGARTPSSRATRASPARADLRRRRGDRGLGRPRAVGEARLASGGRRHRRRRRLLAGRQRAGRGRLPRQHRRHDDRRHVGGGHDRRQHGFATIAAAAFGLPPEKVRVVTADTSSGPYAGASGGSKVTYTVGKAVRAGGRGGAREAPRSCLGGAGDRAGRPRGRGRRRPRRGSARPLDLRRGASRRRRAASAAATSRSRDTAARRRRASPRRSPPTSPTSRSTARRARSSCSATRSSRTSAAR